MGHDHAAVELDDAVCCEYHGKDVVNGCGVMGHRHPVLENRAGIWAGLEAAPGDDAGYETLYPYYAEICALSEIRKKPGLGIPLRSGIGGHSLLYLNGVRRDRQAGYPVLKLCDPNAAPARQGVGISVNSHYKNANWVAADGPDFLWRGALAQGEALTKTGYERTQAQAKAMGVLDGVEFHEDLFRNKPEGMPERDYMYEISVATDYAARFGRDVYRARVPLGRTRMAAVVAYLNDLNAPYREGKKLFLWRVLNNNCAHVAHNALAQAGIWAPWPTGQFFAIAAFNFPVPKNEFVDLAQRTNDLPLADAQAMYNDKPARSALLELDVLPTAPGALAMAEAAIPENEVYDIERLRLIFYDNPFWGPYRFRFAQIFKDPRYADLRANLRHFERVYATALENIRSERSEFSGERARFQICYAQYIAAEAARVSHQLASLAQTSEALAEAGA
jgi:hypothetical protein